MKHLQTITRASALALLTMVSTANAYNITIYDLQGSNGIGKGREDQETEPGTLTGQEWDLEAFDLTGSTLTVYSGFDILNGQDPYRIGDIFIDVDGDANWQPGTDNGTGGTTSNGLFKFDYVIHWTTEVGANGVANNYDVIALDASSVLNQTTFKGQSNPWTYASGGTAVTGYTGLAATISSDPTGTLTLSDGSQVTGGSAAKPHYIASFDISFLTLTKDTLFKLTQECGNDDLVGRVNDAGSALALLGAAMTGVSMFVRRSRKS